MKKTLYLVRGPTGSGKTTLAKKLAPKECYSADDLHDGLGEFKWQHLADSHKICESNVRKAMQDGKREVAVHNTFSMKKEATAYFEMAKEHGYIVFVIECQNDFGSVHEGVPEGYNEKLKQRWQPLQ